MEGFELNVLSPLEFVIQTGQTIPVVKFHVLKPDWPKTTRAKAYNSIYLI